MNRMTVQEIWANAVSEHNLIETMGLGCETDAYDPMNADTITAEDMLDMGAEIVNMAK